MHTLAGQKAKPLDSPMLSLEDALTSLHEHFGFDDFREGQREVIGAILEGKDAVVVMPTGSGKSLCYQLPAMMLEGATNATSGSLRRLLAKLVTVSLLVRPVKSAASSIGPLNPGPNPLARRS